MTIALPLEAVMPHSPQRLHPHQLALSARRMYAQLLAERIHADTWTRPAKRLQYGDTPSFQVRGAGMIPTPLIIEFTTGGHARSGVPAARILLGNATYYNTMVELPEPQFEAWLAWLCWRNRRPTELGHRYAAVPALFHSDGPSWRRARGTNEPEQDAAVTILEAATIWYDP